MDIFSLFEADSMKEVKRVASLISVSYRDLYILIKLSESKIPEFPYLHQSKFHNETPTHLSLTGKNLLALSQNGVGPLNKNAKKAINKLFQMVVEVRRESGHIFYNQKYWHMFFFDIKDTNQIENHWKEGSHLHYVNWLWPNLDAQKAWSHFCKAGKKGIGKSLHIKKKKIT